MRKPARATSTLLAAIAYLGVALWHLRAVLPAPATLLPEGTGIADEYVQLGRLDQAMVVGVVAGNAHRIASRPAALRDEGPCHPLPRSYTLGEHMFGEGLLASLPLALTGDPIASYNALLVLMLWIPALTMYALARHFTGSAPAAFVAGLLFALEPSRMRDAGHPFIHGDLWTPLGLLFLHRMLARGGAGNAFACALFFGLEVLESFYALLASFLTTLVYGLYAAVRHRARLARRLPLLLAAGAAVAALALYVLGPYLETRRTWNLPSRPGSLFMPLWAYAPGEFGFLGWTTVILVALALADRLRRRRDEEGEDPRLAFLVAGLVVLWCSVTAVPVAGFELPSPLLLAKDLVPGLDAVRALSSVGRGATLSFAVLAAYGVVALAEGLGRRTALAVAALASAAVLAERYVPALVAASFGKPLDLAAYAARPPEEDVAALRAHVRGAVLDLPLPEGGAPGTHLPMASYLLLHAYAPRPIAACYNSFASPLQRQLAELADALPAAHAADALAALGFETVVLHLDLVSPRGPAIFAGRVANDPEIARRLELLARTPRLMLFRLRTPLPVARDGSVLAAEPLDGMTPIEATARVAPGERPIALRLHNAGDRVFAHPEPIAPMPVRATWRTTSGETLSSERSSLRLPLAVAPGKAASALLDAAAPAEPGYYVLTVEPVRPARGGAWTVTVEVVASAAPQLEAAVRNGAARDGAPQVDTQQAPW